MAAQHSPVARQNQRTVGLLLLAAALGGLGIGLAFARRPFAGALVLAGAVLGLAAAVSSLVAGRHAVREVVATRCVECRHLLTFGVLGAEVWYASFLLRL